MMIKKSPQLFLLFFSLCLFSQKIIKKTIASEYLEVDREIKIYIPEGYDEKEEKNYPLAIVLDAGYLFDAYVGNSVLFAAKDKAPKQIIVGVNMAETKKEDTYFDIKNGSLTSSNQMFYQFIKNEVFFEIESNYKTSPFISIIGEGTSANLISHFLEESKPFINSYICINPNFSNFVIQEIQSYDLKKFTKEDNTFYLYTNNSTSFSTQKQAKIRALQTNLSSLQLNNFNIINDKLKTSSDTSAMGEAIPRAINKIFEIYSGISNEEFKNSVEDLAPRDAIDYLENKYIEIEFLFGSSLKIRKEDIYVVEKIIIDKENGDYLREFGEMIVKRFPSSPLGDYYIGRYYEEGKNIKKAVKYYKIGYGKMDPSDPNADIFYENIIRLCGQ
jgi:predicted alpha/beta superfamily hydrolase|tara:strand:+ start:2227 stop:3387 length:1161 start_codon:yes stop_codon:yes gene_type:complete